MTKRRNLVLGIILAALFFGLAFVLSGSRTEHHALYAQSISPTGDSTSASGAATVPAQPAQQAEYKPLVGAAVPTVSIIKMIAALAIVIVCIYGGIFLLKKVSNRRLGGRGKSRLLEVLETAYIDPKKSLSLVRVADKSVLIGVTDNQISFLTELDPQHTTAVMETAAKPAGGESFVDALKAASGKLVGKSRE